MRSRAGRKFDKRKGELINNSFLQGLGFLGRRSNHQRPILFFNIRLQRDRKTEGVNCMAILERIERQIVSYRNWPKTVRKKV
jgi:hypothetical protein